MIYSESENKAWWVGLSEAKKRKLIDRMIEVTGNSAFAVSIMKQYEAGNQMTPRQIQSIRRWER